MELELLFDGVVVDTIRAHDVKEALEIIVLHSREFDDQNEDIKNDWLTLHNGQNNPVVTIRIKQ